MKEPYKSKEAKKKYPTCQHKNAKWTTTFMMPESHQYCDDCGAARYKGQKWQEHEDWADNLYIYGNKYGKDK